jgi:hypothetical protein
VIRALVGRIDRIFLYGKVRSCLVWLFHMRRKRICSQGALATFQLGVFSDQLSDLFAMFGSDKGLERSPSGLPAHRYSAIYQILFRPYRNKNFCFLEIGIGTNQVGLVSNMGLEGCIGASLKAWENYFKNAHIFAFDIDDSCQFQSSRITTGLADQTDEVLIFECMQRFGNPKFDIIIDDGLHASQANQKAFEYLRPWFSEGAIYVIEDIHIAAVDEMSEWAKKLGLDFCFYLSEQWNDENSNLMVIYPEGDL